MCWPRTKRKKVAVKALRVVNQEFILLLDFDGGCFDHFEIEVPRILDPLNHLLSLKESLMPGNFSHEAVQFSWSWKSFPDGIFFNRNQG